MQQHELAIMAHAWMELTHASAWSLEAKSIILDDNRPPAVGPSVRQVRQRTQSQNRAPKFRGTRNNLKRARCCSSGAVQSGVRQHQPFNITMKGIFCLRGVAIGTCAENVQRCCSLISSPYVGAVKSAVEQRHSSEASATSCFLGPLFFPGKAAGVPERSGGSGHNRGTS